MSKFMSAKRVFADGPETSWFPLGCERSAVQILREMFGNDHFIFKDPAGVRIDDGKRPSNNITWHVWYGNIDTGIKCKFSSDAPPLETLATPTQLFAKRSFKDETETPWYPIQENRADFILKEMFGGKRKNFEFRDDKDTAVPLHQAPGNTTWKVYDGDIFTGITCTFQTFKPPQ